PARRIVRQRRSAVDMDGHTSLGRDAFYRMLLRTVPACAPIPFASLPWRPCVHLGLFVHRVEGLEPGLFVLVRDPQASPVLRESMHQHFAWAAPQGCPPELPLYQLSQVDCRALAAGVSCGQEIASDGVYAAAMLAAFQEPLQHLGPWFYRRLHWEAGLVG